MTYPDFGKHPEGNDAVWPSPHAGEQPHTDRRPRVGDPAPEDLFDPLDAIDVMLGTMPTSEAGAISLTGEDLQAISTFLRQARAERRVRQRAFRDAIRQRNEAQQGWSALLAEKMCEPPAWRPDPIAEDIEMIPGPGGSRVLVGKGISATDALEKLKTLGELTDRGLGRIEQAIERMSDETRSRLDKAEQAIGAISDQAGGRIAMLEERTEEQRRQLWQERQDAKALAKRLEEAEADHSRLQSRVIELEAQAGIQRGNFEATERRISNLEAHPPYTAEIARLAREAGLTVNQQQGQDTKAMTQRLEKAEKTLSAQGQELLSLNQRLYVDSTGNRITRLESDIAELRRRLNAPAGDLCDHGFASSCPEGCN